MARLREFDESAAVAAVEAVFWAKGYDGASYADLMKATGLGKGSLYAAFGDKRALYRQALTHYVDREISILEAALSDPQYGKTPRDRFSAVLRYPIMMAEGQGTARLGCFLCHSAMETAPHDPEIAEIASRAMTRIDTAMGAGLAAIGAPVSLAPMFGAAYFGIQVMARSGARLSALEAAVDGALSILAEYPKPE